MSIQINASTALVNFATNNNASIIGLQSKTVFVWLVPVNSTNATTLCTLIQQAGPGTNEYWYILLNSPGATSGRVAFGVYWNTTYGIWHTGASLLNDGVLNSICVTYNAGSPTNDPVIYLNGVSVGITESSTPAGTWLNGTNSEFYIGTFLASTPNFKELSICYYNRIFTADEVMSAHNSKLAIPSYRGLVFAPELYKAAGVATFDGAVLGASNTLRDHISGAVGTPSGSPIARADNYLTFANMT